MLLRGHLLKLVTLSFRLCGLLSLKNGRLSSGPYKVESYISVEGPEKLDLQGTQSNSNPPSVAGG